MSVFLAQWQMTARSDEALSILPDGCCDLIFYQPTAQQGRWFVSSLQDAPQWIEIHAGDHFTGYRLPAGCSVQHQALLASLPTGPLSYDDVQNRLVDFTRCDPATREALDRLATVQEEGLEAVARDLGVSLRCLQRHLQHHSGRPPRYWFQLARIRRAGRAIAQGQPCAEVAAEGGFADQAHMTRSLRRWLGVTPSVLRRSPALIAQLAGVGYGDFL